MFRYLMNVLWVVLGQPRRVVKPYRPSLLIECEDFCGVVFDNYLAENVKRKARRQKVVLCGRSWGDSQSNWNYALQA